MAEQKIKYGTANVLVVTALQSLTNSATVGWKSVLVDNTSTLAVDYLVYVKLTTANTAPAAPKTASVYIAPYYSDATAYSDGGTGTLPTSGDATYTIASPNNLKLLGVMNYTTQQQVMQGEFLLSNCFGNNIPQGFLIIIINNTGAALSTGCVVDVTPITYTIA